MALCTLKRSAEFQRVRGGVRWASPLLVVEARQRPTSGPQHDAGNRSAPAAKDCPRFGFTITRKIGNAVVRNRLRRRFKEILRAVAPELAKPATDYVVVARPAVAAQTFARMKADLEAALAAIARKSTTRAGDDPHPAIPAGASARRRP